MSSRSQPRAKKKKTSSARRAPSKREGVGRRVTESAEHMVSSIKSALSGKKRQKAA